MIPCRSPGCSLRFSSYAILRAHAQSYGHYSSRALKFAENRAARRGKKGPTKQKAKKFPKAHAQFLTGSSSSSTDNSGSSESASSSSSSSSTSSITSAESSSSRAAAAAAATTLTAAATAAAAQLQAEPGVPSPAPVVAAAAEVEVPVRSAVVGVPVAKKEVQGRGRLTATTSSRNWRAAPVIIARFGLALLVRMIPMAPQVTATRPFLTFPTARVISMKRLGQRRARPAISSQCSPRKQMTVWWCLLARCWARNATSFSSSTWRTAAQISEAAGSSVKMKTHRPSPGLWRSTATSSWGTSTGCRALTRTHAAFT